MLIENFESRLVRNWTRTKPTLLSICQYQLSWDHPDLFNLYSIHTIKLHVKWVLKYIIYQIIMYIDMILCWPYLYSHRSLIRAFIGNYPYFIRVLRCLCLAGCHSVYPPQLSQYSSDPNYNPLTDAVSQLSPTHITHDLGCIPGRPC